MQSTPSISNNTAETFPQASDFPAMLFSSTLIAQALTASLGAKTKRFGWRWKDREGLVRRLRLEEMRKLVVCLVWKAMVMLVVVAAMAMVALLGKTDSIFYFILFYYFKIEFLSSDGYGNGGEGNASGEIFNFALSASWPQQILHIFLDFHGAFFVVFNFLRFWDKFLLSQVFF